MSHYTPLQTYPLPAKATLCEPDPAAVQYTMDSPAVRVLTDLALVAAVVTEPHERLETAHEMMQQRGVRMLLVLDGEGTVAGLITATDILGEKPMNVVRDRRIRHSEILVSDVMTPVASIDTFAWKTVQTARVGDVVARLQEAQRQHALVTEVVANGQVLVRGIFSLSQIARQLGMPLQLSHAADSFAEIEAALV